MKAFLMYADRDFDAAAPLPWNEAALTQDLELGVLWNAMAAGDKFLHEVARKATLMPICEPHAIRYRQDVLKDALQNGPIVRALYQLSVEAIDAERNHFWGLGSKWPSSILRHAVAVMDDFLPRLRRLRGISEEHAAAFRSRGFAQLFATLQEQLPDGYFEHIQAHLRKLRFQDGVLVSAELGEGNKGAAYVLRGFAQRPRSWLERLFGAKDDAFTFRIHPRDEAGWRALSQLNDRGINLVADALARSCDHILAFWLMLRTELAFYVSCLNLHERLSRYGAATCFPEPVPVQERRHTAQGLYDACLSLQTQRGVVDNDLDADGKNLVIITGANQGGKSTFLRAVGLAQLMMQCGMYVPARAFTANVCDGLLTHYKREEDPSMKSGKLDEELSRMNELADHMTGQSLVLFNESFAATNEREGSEIAEQIVSALLDAGTKMFFVTHLYEFANAFAERDRLDVAFLRAERRPDGTRTYNLLQGPPLKTSYGEDLYARIFGGDGRD
jgi:hypothetical protein